MAIFIRQRKSEQKRVHQKELNDLCISRMYVREFLDQHVEVTYYVSAHTGHELGSPELPFLPLPESTVSQHPATVEWNG